MNCRSSPPHRFRGPRLWRALLCSLDGLRSAARHEFAFRLELLAAGIMVPLALALPLSAGETALLIAAVVGVLVVELVNTAVETLVDLASPERHPLAGRAKDLGSAAVLVSLVGCALVWSIVLAAHFVR